MLLNEVAMNSKTLTTVDLSSVKIGIEFEFVYTHNEPLSTLHRQVMLGLNPFSENALSNALSKEEINKLIEDFEQIWLPNYTTYTIEDLEDDNAAFNSELKRFVSNLLFTDQFGKYTPYEYYVDYNGKKAPQNIASFTVSTKIHPTNDQRSDEDIEEPLDVIEEHLKEFLGIDYIDVYQSHGNIVSNDTWKLEKDESIKVSAGTKGVPVELVTPALPYKEAMTTLSKVCEFIEKFGYTNSTTGLHLNISCKNLENLDYLKLILFSGSDAVAEEFGRKFNRFCVTHTKEIERLIQIVTSDPLQLVKNIESIDNLSIKSSIISEISQEKYYAINFSHTDEEENSRVEFRMIGNSGYEKKAEQVINYCKGFIIALTIACDTTDKYKKDYIKKFYKLLQSCSSVEDDLKQRMAKKLELDVKSFSEFYKQKNKSTKK